MQKKLIENKFLYDYPPQQLLDSDNCKYMKIMDMFSSKQRVFATAVLFFNTTSVRISLRLMRQ